MLTLNTNDFNIDIKKYDKIIDTLEVKTIKCPICGHCDLERHGYYSRYINISKEKIEMTILRVRCKSCGKTHAVLPSFIVPYLHTSIIELHDDVVSIDEGKTPDKDEHEIKQIKKIHRKWKEILLSLGLNIRSKLFDLVRECFRAFKQCFMQIHRGRYYLNT